MARRAGELELPGAHPAGQPGMAAAGRPSGRGRLLRLPRQRPHRLATGRQGRRQPVPGGTGDPGGLWPAGEVAGAVGAADGHGPMGLAFLATHPGAAAPLDVGPSAVVVAAGAALVVWSRSLGIAALYLVGVAVDVLISPDLATAEHLLALATGAGVALILRRGWSLGLTPVSRKAQARGPKSPRK